MPNGIPSGTETEHPLPGSLLCEHSETAEAVFPPSVRQTRVGPKKKQQGCTQFSPASQTTVLGALNLCAPEISVSSVHSAGRILFCNPRPPTAH